MSVHGLTTTETGDVVATLEAATAHVDAFGAAGVACVVIDGAGQIHTFTEGNVCTLLGATAVLEDVLVDHARGREP